MLFLTPNQQCQSIEENGICWEKQKICDGVMLFVILFDNWLLGVCVWQFSLCYWLSSVLVSCRFMVACKLTSFHWSEMSEWMLGRQNQLRVYRCYFRWDCLLPWQHVPYLCAGVMRLSCRGLLVCHCHFIQPQGCKINKIWLMRGDAGHTPVCSVCACNVVGCPSWLSVCLTSSAVQ